MSMYIFVLLVLLVNKSVLPKCLLADQLSMSVDMFISLICCLHRLHKQHFMCITQHQN